MTGNVFNVVARIEQCVALVAKEEQEDYCSVPALNFYRQMPDDLLKINENLILKVFNLFIQLDGFSLILFILTTLLNCFTMKNLKVSLELQRLLIPLR